MSLLQVPGGPELLIIGLIFLLPLTALLLLGVVAVMLFRRRDSNGETAAAVSRIDELERRVTELERQLDDRDATAMKERDDE